MEKPQNQPRSQIPRRSFKLKLFLEQDQRKPRLSKNHFSPITRENPDFNPRTTPPSKQSSRKMGTPNLAVIARDTRPENQAKPETLSSTTVALNSHNIPVLACFVCSCSSMDI